MVLKFGTGLFGDNNYLAENEETFVVTEDDGGMFLTIPAGTNHDLTMTGLSLYGNAKAEVSKTRGYKFTVKLFNAYGSAVAFTYTLLAAGVEIGTGSISLANYAQYTQNHFFTTEEVSPGELIQLAIGGDNLGTDAAATYLTFLEFKVETIQERKYGIL